MPLSQSDLLNYLDRHSILYTLYKHTPIVTVEQGLALKSSLEMPGTGIKNLFLKDDRKNFYLISATFDTKINLRAFGKLKNIKGLRFADQDLLLQHLGVLPGSVTPLALINDLEQKVHMILDSNILNQDYIQIHPLENNATVVITPADLVRFFNLNSRTYITHDFNEDELIQNT